jgi:hypothetical protein
MRDFGPLPGEFAKGASVESARLPHPVEIGVYVPESYRPGRPAPLLVAFHGAGGDGREEHRRWQATADALGMVVVSPTESGPNEGYLFSARERDEAMAAIRWARRRFHVDENRIHLTGISRGGHLAWDIGLRHADRWASLSPMVGGPRLAPESGQNNMRFLENAVHLSIRDLQGLQDDPGMLFNLRLAFAKLKALGALDIEYLTFADLGHSFRMEAVDWKEFFGQAGRHPLPVRVVRQCATESEGRAFWAEILKLDPRIREEVVPRVEAAEWNAMDEEQRKQHVAAFVESSTARLEIHLRAPGVFEAKTYRVKRFRILLTPEMIGPGGQVTVTWNGKVVTKKPPVSRMVLTAEFAEHFDRTFLPVAEVAVP